MQRGVDRGELPKGTPMGQLRDVFFGTLEFSARTLKLRKRSYDHSVVTNLLSIMVCSTGGAAGRPKDEDPSNRDLMNTLKSIQKQLQTSGNSQSIGRRFQSYRSHHSIDSTISAKGPGNPCPAPPGTANQSATKDIASYRWQGTRFNSTQSARKPLRN